MPRQCIERGLVALRRMEQLLEPRAEKEQRHIRISGLDRLRLRALFMLASSKQFNI